MSPAHNSEAHDEVRNELFDDFDETVALVVALPEPAEEGTGSVPDPPQSAAEASDPLQAFLASHADAELLPEGGVRCTTTRHVMAARVHTLEEHWGGKRYRMASRPPKKVGAHARLVWVPDRVTNHNPTPWSTPLSRDHMIICARVT